MPASSLIANLKFKLTHYHELEELRKEHQTITRLACDRCREIEARGGTVPDWAQKWWQEHQRKDAVRLKLEAKAVKESEIRRQAIAKLTPEERAELGV